MKLTIYSVHSDSDRGSDLEMFLSKEAEEAYCAKLIRESGNKQAFEMLDADGNTGEAWFEFTANSDERFSRHETDIELPEPYASAPELLSAVKEMLSILNREIPMGLTGAELAARKRVYAIIEPERSTP